MHGSAGCTGAGGCMRHIPTKSATVPGQARQNSYMPDPSAATHLGGEGGDGDHGQAAVVNLLGLHDLELLGVGGLKGG